MTKDYSDHRLLLVRLKNRDIAAFEYLYKDARVWLYGLAYSILLDERAAQDLVQDFFIEFWQKEFYLQIDHSLKGYLLKSIRHRAYNYLQKEYTRKERENRLLPAASLILPDNKLEREEIQKAIDAALSKVPPAAAEVFSLHYLQQLSHLQIAEKLGISTHTVRNQVAKTLRILRAELKKML